MAEGRGTTTQIDHNGSPLDDLIDTLTGGSLGRVRYAWQTSTAVADPGAGNIRYNHATIASVTSLIVSETDKAAINKAGWFDTFDDSTSSVKGQITITNDFGGAALSNVFNVTGAPVDAGAYWTIPVAYVSGSLPAAGNTSVVVSFVRTGDRGLETIPLGSASAPSIAPTGDSNTGIWFPAADTVAVSTAGVERLRVLSDGKTGFGTLTPNNTIQVAGLINFDPTLRNTYLGVSAGSLAAAATMDSVGVGYNTLQNSNVLNARNTSVGFHSGRALTTGANNTCVGYTSLEANTNGVFNVAIGSRTLEDTTTGDYNIAIGGLAMFDSENVASASIAIGYNTLAVTTTGSHVAIGHQTLSANSTGTTNTGVGQLSLFVNSTGSNNAALGSQALRNINGSNNVAVGSAAGKGTSGTQTCAGGVYIGFLAGEAIQSGADYDTLVGFQSGQGITTGARNLLLGPATISASHNQVTTGSRNISIGNDVAVASATANDQLCIGNLIYGTGLGGTGATISTGFIGVGTKAPGGRLHVLATTGTSGATASTSADDLIVEHSSTGGISILTPDTTGVANIFFGHNADNDAGRIVYTNNGDHMGLFTDGGERVRITSAGVVQPGADNTQDLGAGSLRWATIYAGTGTINTSDERYKALREGGDLTDAEYLAWSNVRAIVYQDKDSVARKGDDARLHIGYSWQTIKAAFEAQGLDASRYALWCEDPVTEIVTKTRTASRQAVDENGVGLTEVAPVLEDGEPVMEQVQAVEVTERTVREVRMVDGVPTLFDAVQTIETPLFDEVQVANSATGEPLFEMVQATDPATGALLFDEVQKTDPFYGHPMTHEVQATEEVTVIVEEVHLVDGAPVLVRTPKTIQQPIFDLVQVKDGETGELLFRETDGDPEPVLAQVPRMVSAPLMVSVRRMVEAPVMIQVPRVIERPKTEVVAVMEEYEETYEAREPTGETIGALRYQECAVLEAAWLRRELAQLAARVAALEPA